MLFRLMRAALLAAGAASLALTQTFHFTLPADCHLPFAAIAPTDDASAACDVSGHMSGHPTPGAPKTLESAAKNNFCADTSTIVPMHFEDFSRLENGTDRSLLNLATNRDDLKIVEDVTVHGNEVGEGTVVQLVAMMRGAHVSDCSTKTHGEAVNCNMLGTDKNDMHIVLMPLEDGPDDSECDSVTAEAIPHFRPDAWSNLDLKTPSENPVRVTGQLFYDDSHKACVGGKGSPMRRTVWEIHPMYQLEVCTGSSADACKQDDATVWVPYDKWVTQSGAHTAATGKKQRQACVTATTNGGH